MQPVYLVGILNLTPDSFSDDGINENEDLAIIRARQLFREGASFIDVGAEATNPWASTIASTIEWERLEPVLSRLLPEYPDKISVDTYHSDTVESIVKKFGTHFIVNDVTGMNEPSMRKIVARHSLRCIVSHLPARFGTDIKAAHASATMNSEKEVFDELNVRRNQLVDLGLEPDKIILDPGIGFGKTKELNALLLQFAHLAHRHNLANQVMIGYSRKRFLGEHRFEVEPNLEAARTAITAGATHLRVHDVVEHRELIDSLALKR